MRSLHIAVKFPAPFKIPPRGEDLCYDKNLPLPGELLRAVRFFCEKNRIIKSYRN